MEPNKCSFPNWATFPSISHDFLYEIIPCNEDIMEAMAIGDWNWEDMNHHSSFLLDWERVENKFHKLVFSNTISQSLDPIMPSWSLSKENLGNILKTILIDILVKPWVVESVQINWECSPKNISTYISLFKEVYDVFSWSYE